MHITYSDNYKLAHEVNLWDIYSIEIGYPRHNVCHKQGHLSTTVFTMQINQKSQIIKQKQQMRNVRTRIQRN